MAIEGSLQDVGLADICQLLAMGRKTGCLTVTDRSNFGYVYFRHGRVIYASVLNRPDRLGDLLVKNQVITREELSKAMHEQGSSSAPLGEILVRQEALSEEELGRYISLQIEEAVYHLFTWSSGAFHFDPDQTPEEGIFLVDIPAESLLLEGARRVDEWSLIEKKIPSMDLVFTVLKDPSDAEDADFELTQHQTKVLPFLDGVRSLAEIVSDSGMVEFDVAKAIFGLMQAGFVDKAGTRGEGEEGDERVDEHVNLGVAFYRSGMMEDAAREFEAALALDAQNPRALFRLGLVAFREGRFEDALECFARIPDDAREAYAVLRNRALALEFLHRYEEALDVLDRAREVRPDDPELAIARGVVLLKGGDVAGAMKALGRYRDRSGSKTPSPIYYTYAVLGRAMAGNTDAAVQVGREGLGHYPDCGPLLVNTGAVLELCGEEGAAAALYARALQSPRPPAQAHKNLGDHAYSKGNLDQARTYYEKAVRLEPTMGDDVYTRLGMIADQDGDHDVARLLWRRALALNPGNESVRSKLELLETSN